MRRRSVVAAAFVVLGVLGGLSGASPAAQAAGTWTAEGPGVFGLGDSLFMQCGESLGVGTRSLGMIGWAGGTTEGIRGRLTSTAAAWPYLTEESHADELADLRSADTWVVGLGTNDVRGSVSASRYRANVDWVLQRAAGRPVLWFNLVNPDAGSRVNTFNGILANAATRWPNLRVLDWAGYVRDNPDAVMADGVHLASYSACRDGRLALIRDVIPPVAVNGSPDPDWEDPPPQDPPVPDPVTTEYTRLGGPGGALGPPTGPVSCQRKGDGCVQFYARGGLAWSPDTGVHAMSEAVARAWSHYADTGRVGYPVAAEVCGTSGCKQKFQRGWMFSSGSGAWDVPAGPVLTKYLGRGGPAGALGPPRSLPSCGAPRDGCLQHFRSGSIHWSGRTGARVVSGSVRTAWWKAGGAGGALGYPITDTLCGIHGGGCRQEFTGGSIYSSTASGARIVRGVIRSKWLRSGGVAGRYGYPVAEQRTISGGLSQRFRGGTLTYRNGRWT